jgi:hypothetical protein
LQASLAAIDGYSRRDSEMIMRALNRSDVTFFALFTLFSLQFLLRTGAQLNHDVAWYLYAAGRILDGAVLYADILEVNPPLGIWTLVPVAGLARFSEFDISVIFAVVILGVTAVSIMLVSRMLRRIHSMPSAFINGLLILMALVLLFEPASAFGQREDLLILMVLPWVVLRWARGQGYVPSNAFAVAIGLFAALGFGQKPHCILAAILVECLLLFRTKSIRYSVMPENLAGLFAAILYVVAIWVFTPDFFTRILPLAFAAYLPFYGTSAFAIVASSAFWGGMLLLAAHVSHRCPPQIRSLMNVLLMAALGFLLAFLLQAKGFSYQLLPARISIELAFMAAIAALGAGLLKVEQLPALTKFASTISLTMLAAVAFLYPTARYSDFFLRRISSLSPTPSSLFIASTNVSNAFPLVVERDLTWGSRFPTQWLAPYAALSLGANGAPTDDLSRFALKATVDDLIQFQPEVIVIDERPKQAYFRSVPLEFARFWQNDSRFANLWCNYELRAREQGFSFWQRTSDPRCRAER